MLERHAQVLPLLALGGGGRGREFFIDNLLVRIQFIIVMIRWTGLAPWEFEFPLQVPPLLALGGGGLE